MHADSNGRLIRDKQQDCKHFYVNAGTRSLHFERDFDTCDDDDYLIEVQFVSCANLIKKVFLII